ncbi:phosphatase 2C-like domain-containing protein [Gorgonomyces haynaldii]|nr:phosphatase 2C-like domain-containing protein [Gorgonomyces haynaldii]
MQQIHWAVSQQTGYKAVDGKRFPLHDRIEDVHYPVNEADHFTSQYGHQVFVMADGHAGSMAPNFFVSKVNAEVLKILDEKDYDFGLPEMQQEIADRITQVFKLADAEYTAIKVNEYQTWIANKCPSHQKPVDDGCTLMVNIVGHGWIMNCNVGDSRTVIGCQRNLWEPVFASADHNMAHAQKAYDIYVRGGKFLNPFTTTLVAVQLEDPATRGDEPFHELAHTRLYRPLNDAIKTVGCSHRRTLNLSGTMGDLLFKIEPAVLVPTPDITFIRLEQGSQYCMVMATDGLWDHLNAPHVEVQNCQVLEYIARVKELDVYVDDLPSLEETSSTCSLNNKAWLQQSCAKLCDREGDPSFFTPNLPRYDDCTVLVAYIECP